MNTLDQTLGQIARDLPGATAVFRTHKLDFCCGGRKTLREATLKHNLDAEAIVAELGNLKTVSQAKDPVAEASNYELIEHILSRYHDVHRQQLPELVRLAKRVELVHGGHQACPVGLTDHLLNMQAELEQHMRKEEEILFPMISRGMSRATTGPINVMRHEHDDHGEAITRLRQLTFNITLPEGACNTWQALYAGLQTLVDDLTDHIHLENNILFQRIEDSARGVQNG